jgi:hypothetical protein
MSATTTLVPPKTRADGSLCLNPDEVQVGTANGPGIYLAPPGTTPPPATGDWPSPWECLGYLSDDGPTIAQSTDSEDITPWQSVVPIKSIITSRGVTCQFVMWQLNERTIGLYFDVTPPALGTGGELEFDVRTDTPQQLYSVGIDSADAARIFRVSFYRASLTDAGDMQIQRGAVIPLDVTLSALDDGGRLAHVSLVSGNGNGDSGETGEGRTVRRDVSRDDLTRAQRGAGGAGSAPRPGTPEGS